MRSFPTSLASAFEWVARALFVFFISRDDNSESPSPTRLPTTAEQMPDGERGVTEVATYRSLRYLRRGVYHGSMYRHCRVSNIHQVSRTPHLGDQHGE